MQRFAKAARPEFTQTEQKWCSTASAHRVLICSAVALGDHLCKFEFCHGNSPLSYFGILKNRFPFSMVMAATASVVSPLISAIFSATLGT